MKTVNHFLRSEDGPAAVEYAVMLALVAAVVMVTMATFGANVEQLYLVINDAVN